MQQCAGNGHWFEAANASQLADAFEVISDSVGDLRLTD
jgi:hypothetical protein